MSSNVDQVFRTEWPRLVATLVRDLRDLELAEDCAQEAFLEAARRWADDGMPDRPGAWLLTTARRRAIDRIRRSDRFEEKLSLLEAAARTAPSAAPAQVLIDDQLALLLGCCHPALDIDAQVALTLRVVAGLTTGQIAHAFLVSEPTMTRRITRAKTKIRKAGIPFSVPDGETLAARLESITHVIYLVFTEGHASATSADLVRGDLCDEAIWLAGLLTELVTDDAEVHGLAALLLLTDARRPTRVDQSGAVVLLEDQDRSRWDATKISAGISHLARAHSVDDIGPFSLQAAIGAVHCKAPSFAETDWEAILEIYDRLITMSGSPVLALNRAVAVSYVDGPDAGLAELDRLETGAELDSYHYLHSARAELLRRLGRNADAAVAYRRSLEFAANDAERLFLQGRLEEVNGS